jgi:serine/threonine protein phosphatase PrpC
MDVRMVVLAGPECEDLGHFAIRALSPAAAIASSAGRLPKLPAPVDPNEDAAFVAVSEHGALAAVIDGHLGFDVANGVLEALKAIAEPLLKAPITDLERTLAQVVADAQDASRAVVGAVTGPRVRSGAAASLALAANSKVAVTTLGDTVALLASPKAKPRRFARESAFLHDPRSKTRVEVVKAPPGSRLMLATDGLVDYTTEGLPASILVATLGNEPREAVYALMDAALLGGAGDNVTVLCVDLDRLDEAVSAV